MNSDAEISRTNINVKRNFLFLFLAILIVFPVLMTASYLLLLSAMKSKMNNNAAINIAGRQKMLINKYVKEFVEDRIPLQVRFHKQKTEAIDTLEIVKDQKPYTKEVEGFEANSFHRTREIFETSLAALINGGTVLLDMEMTKSTTIPAVVNPTIRSKLIEAEKLWLLTLEHFNKLLVTEPDSSEYIIAHNEGSDTANDISRIMDQVVTSMQIDLQNKLDRINMFQIVVILIEATLFLITWVFIYFKIVTPLERKSIDLENQRELYISLNSELAKANEKEKEQNWLAAGQARLNDVMRGVKEINTLSRDIICCLAPYLHAQVGAIYLADYDQNLSLAGSYALKNQGDSRQDCKFGEGLLGQSAKDRKCKILTNVPDGYFPIRSGLAEISPRNIIIKPFLYEGHVKGVIELGLVSEFSGKQMDFLKLVEESIGIAIHTAQSRRQLQDLLKESRCRS